MYVIYYIHTGEGFFQHSCACTLDPYAIRYADIHKKLRAPVIPMIPVPERAEEEFGQVASAPDPS